MRGHLINKVQPQYPQQARVNGISGTVHLHAIIGKDGRIRSLTVMDGHPTLAYASQEAVRQWRYAPYMRDGQPVEVETTITVKFGLGGP